MHVRINLLLPFPKAVQQFTVAFKRIADIMNRHVI